MTYNNGVTTTTRVSCGTNPGTSGITNGAKSVKRSVEYLYADIDWNESWDELVEEEEEDGKKKKRRKIDGDQNANVRDNDENGDDDDDDDDDNGDCDDGTSNEGETNSTNIVYHDDDDDDNDNDDGEDVPHIPTDDWLERYIVKSKYK